MYLSLVMQCREQLQKLATARRISSGGRGAVMCRRRVQCKKGVRDLFIIQCISHNTRARLKSVMMLFSNVKFFARFE